MVDKKKAVRNYLCGKLLENSIVMEKAHIDEVVDRYAACDGWKEYIDRFIDNLLRMGRC